MLLKRIAVALTLAAVLLAVGGSDIGYEWGYYMVGGMGFSMATSSMCWGLSMYFSYIAFCPACVGAGFAGSAACMLGAWA